MVCFMLIQPKAKGPASKSSSHSQKEALNNSKNSDHPFKNKPPISFADWFVAGGHCLLAERGIQSFGCQRRIRGWKMRQLKSIFAHDA